MRKYNNFDIINEYIKYEGVTLDYLFKKILKRREKCPLI